MSDWLGSALVQEAVSRGVSFGFSRREEKASQGHLVERLEMAVSQLEFALERTQDLRIRHISLLHRRKMFKRAYAEAVELLDKHKQQQQVVPAEQELQDTHGLKKRKLWVVSAKNLLTTCSLAGLRTDDVRRFEWYADGADKFVRDMESGCSLRHNTFCNPIVRHLLEGKTLRYEFVEQGNLRRKFYIWPVHSVERGMEAVLEYLYEDSRMAEKCFALVLVLRLSDSTDIVGVAIKGLQLLTSAFKVAAECAMGELTTLLSTNFQGISHSYGPPLSRPLDLNKNIQIARPDPACCKGSRHGLCSKDNISSRLADILPEQVIFWVFNCCIPALGSSTRSSFNEVGRGWKPPLELFVVLMPHFQSISYFRSLVRYFIDSWKKTGRVKCNNYIYAVETIGDDVENRKFMNNVSIEEVTERIKSNAINCFSRQPELREYRIDWASKHGDATFYVQNVGVARTRKRYNTRARTRRSGRRLGN